MDDSQSNMLAVDFGASSGRTILGRWNGSTLTTQEIHPFSNDPVELNVSLYWDFLRLFHELKEGVLAYKQHATGAPASLAVDTWGVDYGLVSGNGKLLGNPYHYREARNEQAMGSLLKTMPVHELYAYSGIQPLGTPRRLTKEEYKEIQGLESEAYRVNLLQQMK